MKITEMKSHVVEEVTKIKCDVCGKEYEIDDAFEIQEFVHIEQTGGYGSVFGDGTQIHLDMCQHCMKEKLGEYLVKRKVW